MVRTGATRLAPSNRGALDSTHVRGTRVPVEEPSTHQLRTSSPFRQELHPVITYWVPVLLRTGFDSRPIARHEYPMKAIVS